MPEAPAIAQTASPGEMELLLRSFNDAAGRLQETHERLGREVVRLEGELRETKERLRRSERLAALGEMAAGIAHEVRNPLSSIRLYAKALEEDLVDRPGEQGIARKIGGAVVGLDRVVGDVLAFARRLDVRPAPCASAALFERALASCAAAVQDAGAAVQILGESAPLACDTELIHQALVNVIRNAAEAAGEAPQGRRRITLSAGLGDLRGPSGARAPAVCLRVRDTGPGVSDEALERMFNPFFTTRCAGTGLGLAIVQRIMDGHGGAVRVRNVAPESNGPPEGAEVELVFPAPEGAAAPRREQGG